MDKEELDEVEDDDGKQIKEGECKGGEREIDEERAVKN
jgi:hypothetical protein